MSAECHSINHILSFFCFSWSLLLWAFLSSMQNVQWVPLALSGRSSKTPPHVLPASIYRDQIKMFTLGISSLAIVTRLCAYHSKTQKLGVVRSCFSYAAQWNLEQNLSFHYRWSTDENARILRRGQIYFNYKLLHLFKNLLSLCTCTHATNNNIH